MNTIFELLNSYLKISAKRTQGEYFVKRVDCDLGDAINYEVSCSGQGVHVYFSDRDCMEDDGKKMTAKSQAKFYAHAANTYKPLVEALLVAVETLHDSCYTRALCAGTGKPCTSCFIREEIKTILGVGEK